MLYIYFEIRYYNQLMKIVPGLITELAAYSIRVVQGNGGIVLQNMHPYVFCFDCGKIGSTVGAARSLDSINTILYKNKRRLSEYTILCEKADEFFDYGSFFSSRSRKILSDYGCFCYSGAYNVLKQYIACDRSIELDLYDVGLISNTTDCTEGEIDSFVISEKALCKVFESDSASHIQNYTLDYGAYSYNIPSESVILPIHMYPSPQDCMFRSLREMIEYLPVPISELANELPSDESVVFTNELSLLTVFDLSRFELDEDSLFMHSFTLLLKHLFTALDHYAARNHKKITIFIHSAQYLDKASQNLISDLFLQQCVFNTIYIFCMKNNESNEQALAVSRKKILDSISAMPLDVRNLFYLVLKSSQYLFFHEIILFFDYMGKESLYLDAICSIFYGYGLLEVDGDIRSIVKNIRVTGLQCDLQIIENTIAAYLQYMFLQKKIRSGIEFYKILLSLGAIPELSFAENAIFKTYERTLLNSLTSAKECGARLRDRTSFETREMSLASQYLLNRGISEEMADTISCLYDGLVLALKGDVKNALRIFLATKKQSGGSMMGCANCSFILENYSDALLYAKKSLQEYQNCHDVAGESRALQFIANISLVNRKFSDAEDYLTYALSGNDVFVDAIRKISIYKDMLAVCFISGKYTAMENTCTQLYETAVISHDIHSKIFSLFVKARLLQVFGRYTDSSSAFDLCAVVASKYEIADVAELCAVWKARNSMYQGNYSAAATIFEKYENDIPDAVIFEAEFAAITGNQVIDKDHATSISVTIAQYAAAGNLQPWYSGFSLLENKVFTGSELIPLRMLRVFCLYFDSANVSHDTALPQLYSCIRDSDAVQFDPFAGVYYYLYYTRMQNNEQSGTTDSSTVLGRAFKCLQNISSRIDNTSAAHEYMEQPYWNKMILKSAKKHMLF